MTTPGFLRTNLILLALYSAALTIWNGPFGNLSEAHFALVGAHVTVLFLWAVLRRLQQEQGAMRIAVTAFFIGVVGGVTCFWNFMSHMH